MHYAIYIIYIPLFYQIDILYYIYQNIYHIELYSSALSSQDLAHREDTLKSSIQLQHIKVENCQSIEPGCHAMAIKRPPNGNSPIYGTTSGTI